MKNKIKIIKIKSINGVIQNRCIMELKNALFLFLLMPILLDAQSIQVKDYLISGNDNNPSTFIQNNPKLFVYNSGSFLTTWKDYREGDESTFAQWYDSLGNKIGVNFKIYDNDEIVFNKNGTYLNMNEFYAPYFIEGTGYFIDAKIYKSSEEYTREFPVFSIDASGFDIDPLGFDFKCIPKSDAFIFFIRVDGTITSKSFDLNGNFLYGKNLSEDITFRSSKIAAAVDKNDNHILCCFNARNIYDHISWTDTIPCGIYFNMFNADDSLLIKNILIKEFTPPPDYYFNTWNSPQIKCIALNDSLWEIFWLDMQAKTLSYVVVDDSGKVINKINSVTFPEDIPVTFINSFTLSQSQDNTFSLFTSTQGILPNGSDEYFHSLVNFDSEGKFINELRQHVGFYSPLSFNVNNIFRTSDSTFYVVSSDEKDVYLNNVSSFFISKSEKINIDSIGSNEAAPVITNFDKNNYFVSWQNETAYYGVKVDNPGNLIGTKNQFDGKYFFFFPNGNSYNFWSINHEESDVAYSIIGYTLYNKNMEILGKDTVLNNSNIHSQLINILRLTDSSNIMYYRNGSEIILQLLDVNGNKLKENRLNFGINSQLSLYRVNDKSFLINQADKNQYFNRDLDPVSEIFTLYYDLYIGNNRFLRIHKDYVYNNYYAEIKDSSGSIISDNRVAGYNDYLINKIKTFRLPDEGFIIVYGNTELLYARAFSSEGIAKADPFLIHSDIVSSKKEPVLYVNNNSILFAWADNRNKEKGYDIYGSVFNLSKLVSVNEKKSETPYNFNLSQNYPNPFNPTTTIKFTIPARADVQIKIFNILGKEVATLVNEEKSPGEYEIKFDASGLGSGIYFYKIQAGSFSQICKMLLLK